MPKAFAVGRTLGRGGGAGGRGERRLSSSLNKCCKNFCECVTKTFPFNNKNFCALPNELGRGMDVHLLTPHEPNSQRQENSDARREKVR